MSLNAVTQQLAARHLNASVPTADLSEDECHLWVLTSKKCSSLLSKVMAGQIVMRWWKVMSRKQMVGSQWSYRLRKCSHLMTTFWSCAWTLTPGTRGFLSSGSTAFSAAFLGILRRTVTTRRSAQVNKSIQSSHAYWWIGIHSKYIHCLGICCEIH